MTQSSTGHTRELARFLAGIRFADLPQPVVEATTLLFLDWLGSALAGRGAKPVTILEEFAAAMGPAEGPSEILTSRRTTSPLFAALVNAAASHVVEQDDVHNGAVFHPGTIVFPPLLAVAQEIGAGGQAFIAAANAGYETGVRIGRFLGQSHYRVFHTTGTAGTLAAAAAVAHLLGADEETMLQALGSAGTQAAGLWEFLRDAADSKQLHTAKAAADGLLAAHIAVRGFTGAQDILAGPQGMAAGMSCDPAPAALTEGLGRRWAVLETSYKWHASCRHTHPAADALQAVMQEHGLQAADIIRVRARVHAAAIDVLGPVTDPRTLHQAKFSMGFVLALIALRGHAALTDFTDETLYDPAVRDFAGRVEMVLDGEIDAAYPERWIGRVEVETVAGAVLTTTVQTPKGDPENPLTRAEVEDKVRRLAAYSDAAGSSEVECLLQIGRTLAQQHMIGRLLPRATVTA